MNNNNNISMVESKLPPGFRFHPTDEELVCDYLINKLVATTSPHRSSLLMIEVDLNKCEPWDIPESACVGGKDWYFYSQRDRKYATGVRTNRATMSGYWKATGKDRSILRKDTLVGMRKTLVFYKGRAPKGKKTDWVMHEFRLEGQLSPPPNITSLSKEDWVLCKVFYKNKEVITNEKVVTMESNTQSSSFPPLMDSYITFNQTKPYNFKHHLHVQDYVQDYNHVPCFSNLFSSNQVDHNNIHTLTNNQNSTTNIITTNEMGCNHMDQFGQILPGVDPLMPRHDKMVKAVLTQLTKMEPGYGGDDQVSSEIYLSELGMPWNHYY